MSQKWHIGDLHLGHKNVLNYRPTFSSIIEHDEFIIDNILTLVNKRDVLYLHGDIFMSIEAFDMYSDRMLKGINFVYILGNHDLERFSMLDKLSVYSRVMQYQGFRGFGGIIKDKDAWLSHAPIHSEELRNKKNIHGHVHNCTIRSYYHQNVSVDNTAFKPVSRYILDMAFKDKSIFIGK